MTLQIKLILAAIMLLGIGYSYLWVYRQGQINGQADEVKVQLAIREEQEQKFAIQRGQEIQEARAQFEYWKRNELKKTKALEDANRILSEQKEALITALSSTVPDDLIGVLNSRRHNFGADTGDSKPASGSDEKVPAVTGLTERFVAMAELSN